MGENAFRSEDRVGLVAAIVLHAVLVGLLAAQVLFSPDPFVPPERVAVSLATEVSLESTAPSPAEESRAAIAPTLTDVPEPPVEEAAPDPVEEAAPPPPPRPRRALSRAILRRLTRAIAAGQRKPASNLHSPAPIRAVAAAGSVTISLRVAESPPAPTTRLRRRPPLDGESALRLSPPSLFS